MSITCKNCNNTYEGNFCNNCGQSAETHKLNFHFLWHDIQHGLFHFDKGIYYSAIALFTRPGHSIREFIQGKRVNHYQPISLVIVVATVYGLLYSYFHINLMATSAENNSTKLSLEINQWFATHFSWLTLATIPLYTLGTYICFRKQGYNYIEYFVLNTFKASQRLFVHLATFPVIYYFNGTPTIKKITIILYVIDILLIYWTNLQFFNNLTKTKTLLLSILSHIIFLISFITILVIIILIFRPDL